MLNRSPLVALLLIAPALLVAACDSGPTCKPPRATDCAGVCVDLASDSQSCGGCGKSCAQGEACVAGACRVACPTGQLACAGSCVSTSSDAANCGGCGKACQGGEVCAMGRCALACPPGLQACSGACVSTQNDPGHCGDCATACKVDEVCAAGKCGLSCPSSQRVCNRACVDVSSDAQNCSGCGLACKMGESCHDGTCVLVCPLGQIACGGRCVDPLSDAQNCNGCGKVCTDGTSCQSGVCASVCGANQTYCGNGICASLMTDNASCGACGKACANGTVCSMGQCLTGCASPLTSCNNQMSCVDPRNDPDNCGGCGKACPSLPNAARVCVASACAPGPCAPGFADCNAKPADGCEVDTRSDPSNCGGCGASCGGGMCVKGACTLATSCKAIKLAQPNAQSGVYLIDPDGAGPIQPVQVSCDMTRDGGGWTLGVKAWYQSGDFGNPNAVGSVSDGLTLKGNPYKLSDAVIQAFIGPSQHFDLLADQAGYNSSYSTGNYEYVILRNYTGLFRFDAPVPESTTTTTMQSYRLADGALAWTGRLGCGALGGAGINCYTVIVNNPQGGAGCNINMGTSSNPGWHHFYMSETNSDTYLYICNGAQHSSSFPMNHRFWFREY